uniref:elongin A, like n=1 Tax=Centroberyx gerrardi TaxID=166262 RepID=UPI003AAC8E27
MASSSDVVKKIKRFKLQLTDTAESATVLKILQKLKDLDITLDILAETGIGKTVNSLRRHEQAGEFAKSLVRYWKKLVPKESTRYGEASQNMHLTDKLDDQNCPNNVSLTIDKSNNNCLTSHGKSQDTSNELLMKMGNRKPISEKQDSEEENGKGDLDENCQQEKQNILEKEDLDKKMENQGDKEDFSATSKKKKNNQCNRNSGDDDTVFGSKTSEDTQQESRPASREKSRSNSGNSGPEKVKESNKKAQPSSKSTSKDAEEPFLSDSNDKHSKTLFNLANAKGDRSAEMPSGSQAHNRKRRQPVEKKQVGLKYKQESENEGNTKNKKAKRKHKLRENDPEEPSMSFESYLNYDLNVSKRKERSGAKDAPKKIKTNERTIELGMKSVKLPMMSGNVINPKKKRSVMDLLDFPLPAVLPECDKPSIVEYFERKVEKISDVSDISEESAVFTGQRLNKKMQVYSGAKTIFLPAMMSLYQQCIRTLQNNIDLLYETGGVPFDILEPVLERCTPDQLLRIEECNPIYIGVSDHLWEKHCQREFRDSKLEEYESWKEMYTRLSEERERKFKRLTKSIVSAQSKRPKGRQVKMAFIHTVAKPPRDVRIQQEIHGTAAQPPHQLRCSVKVQDNRTRPTCNEPTKSSTTGSSNTQDPRKKTRVAPMMAKSLKAFKKQLGRR